MSIRIIPIPVTAPCASAASSEWSRFREQYRALQKENMAEIKQTLRQQAANRPLAELDKTVSEHSFCGYGALAADRISNHV